MSGISPNWAMLQQFKKLEEEKNGGGGNKRKRKRQKTDQSTKKPTLDDVKIRNEGLTSYVAMDCEMVGVGEDGLRSMLARVSIVNFDGHVLYDKHIKPSEKVTDYRTAVSGIRKSDLVDSNTISFKQCQEETAKILKDRILIGHSIDHDLKCLLLSHPRHLIRDTAHYKVLCPNRPKALKVLMQEQLNIEIQTGEHDSVSDARAVLTLYKKYRLAWERQVSELHRRKKKKIQNIPSKSNKLAPSAKSRKKAKIAKKAMNKAEAVKQKENPYDVGAESLSD